MDEQQSRIQEDLRGLLAGDVRCDDVFVQLYASDASLFQIRPLGVVRPRTAADVAATARYASEHHIPLHARGAGTGLAGEALGPGLVIDFSVYMRRMIRAQNGSVTVQPGLVLERLNTQLARSGRMFGPDPATLLVTTMGSVVAVDGAGSHWLRYGATHQHVRSLDVVLADGSQLELGNEPLENGVSVDPNPRKRDLINQIVPLIADHAELIRAKQPKSLVNRSGYRLADVLGHNEIDMARLLVGSEGTLALSTEITLGTVPLPTRRGLALLYFDRLESAARAVDEIVPTNPAACDLLDRRHLSLAREIDSRYEAIIPQTAEALIVVEYEGEDLAALRDQVRQLVDRVRRRKRLAYDARQLFGREDLEQAWRLVHRVVPTLFRLRGSTRALPFVEDFAIPPGELSAFLTTLQNILKRHEVTASLFGHVGHGQLHLRPFLDMADPAHVAVLQALADDIYGAVFDVSGTISGEHGDGLSRTPYVERQYGELYSVFREIKRIFDPQNILNPGKVISATPESHFDRLRPVISLNGEELAAAATADAPQPPLVDLQLNWTREELTHVATSCNGCGACRAQDESVRMCPIFRFAPAEEASPRAKANLLRGILSRQLPSEALATDPVKDVADLCVNCKMCRHECPAEVDIPKLMIEAKANYVETNGLGPRQWLLTRLDVVCGSASRLAPLINWALANRQARWVFEKTLGLAQGRKLPRIASRPFLRRAARRRLNRPTRSAGRKVLYFVDTYANYNDPQLAEALVAVLEHNGISVFVPSEQQQSGMAMVSLGSLGRARAIAARNIELLAEAVRQGYTIVTAEPSAALCLKQEYPMLLDDEDTRLVAAETQEACHYLWQMHLVGKLQLDMQPVNAVVGYHQPCHLRALGIGSPGESLMRLIPGLTVHRLEKGCSGMAGTYGLLRQNFRNSLRAGLPLISGVREADWLAGTTECSACKMQMEQGTTKPTIHPIKLLALAYRIMPEIGNLLASRSGELVVT